MRAQSPTAHAHAARLLSKPSQRMRSSPFPQYHFSQRRMEVHACREPKGKFVARRVFFPSLKSNCTTIILAEDDGLSCRVQVKAVAITIVLAEDDARGSLARRSTRALSIATLSCYGSYTKCSLSCRVQVALAIVLAEDDSRGSFARRSTRALSTATLSCLLIGSLRNGA